MFFPESLKALATQFFELYSQKFNVSEMTVI